MMLPLHNDVKFGLLCVACVPGGGLGHVAVILGEADLPLSLAMNLISIVAMLGKELFNKHGTWSTYFLYLITNITK